MNATGWSRVGSNCEINLSIHARLASIVLVRNCTIKQNASQVK